MTTSQDVFDCMCRTCMHELVEVFSYEANPKPEPKQWHYIFEKIEKCESLRIIDLLTNSVPQIQMELIDGLPKKICLKCLEQLLIIYRFQQMCLQSDQQIRELIANGNVELKMMITDDAEEHKISTHAFSVQGSLEGRAQGIELDAVNTSPEASQAITAAAAPVDDDPLQSNEQANLNDYVKKEPSDDDVDEPNNIEYSDVESLHSTVTIKNEIVTIETDEEAECVHPSTHNCTRCNKSFKQLRHFQQHLKCHQKRDVQKDMPKQHKPREQFERCSFKCDICNRYFHKAESLNKHRLAHDGKGEIPTYPCELCDRVLSSKQSLTKHKEHKHSIHTRKPKKYICEICDKALINSSALKCHLATHSGERPFLCPECGKAFAQEGNLRQHRLRHLDTEAFECPHCPKNFRTKSYLSKHILIHKDNKKHVCDICGYGFIKAHQLTTHKRYHNGIKPHKCDFCEMHFVTMYAKRRHMRTHTGEKPYKCKYCERAFAQSNDHIKHLRSHIGDNVYRCEMCPAAYRLASELRVHFATHKNDDEETRERNMKALKEAEAKLQPKLVEKHPPV